MTADVTQFLASAQPVFKVDGQEVAALGTACFRLEAMEDDTGLSTLEAVFLNLDHPTQGKPVDFLYFNRQVVDFGKKIEVAFQVTGASTTVFQGIVTAIGGEFPEAREPELILHAEDALAPLRMRRRTRVFDNASDSDIVQQVASDAGLSPTVQLDGPTYVQHLQVNQSDLDMLRERTGAVDGMVILQDNALTVEKRNTAADTLIRLSSYNELLRFTVLADLAHQRTKVRVHGWDVATKQAIHETSDNDDARAIAGPGGRTGPEILAGIWAERGRGHAPGNASIHYRGADAGQGDNAAASPQLRARTRHGQWQSKNARRRSGGAHRRRRILLGRLPAYVGAPRV